MRVSRIAICGLSVLFGLVFCAQSFAEVVHDGFRSGRKIESRYFTVWIEDGADVERLITRLAVPLSIQAIIEEPLLPSEHHQLANEIDTLFLGVLTILDLRIKNFHSNIKICEDQARLLEIAERLFGQAVKQGGFYVASLDTLYVDASSVTLHMMGHELSHAAQTHYFVVPPPQKIQEILAGYVEYELRKYSHALP